VNDQGLLSKKGEIMMKINPFKLVFLLVFSFLCLTAACVSPQLNIPEEVEKNIEERIDNGESVGLVVGFIDPEGNREYFCCGTLTMNGKRPVDEYSVYEIGSITKVFTGIVLADMVLKGEVNLDDPAEQYLPGTIKIPSRNGNKITLGHLASHSSALPRMPFNFRPIEPENPYADYTVENMYAFLSAYHLQRDIGEKYEYSNLGMGLLGHILSLRAKMDYEQLIIQRVCRVLGMEDTKIAFTEDMKKRLARGHDASGEVPNWDIPTLAGAGALRSTAADMLTFLGANMGIKHTPLLPAMEMAHEPRVQAGNDMKVGLAWHIRDNGKTQIVWHNGGTGGYRTFCGFVKDKNTGVVILSNMNIGADDIGFHLLDSSYALKKVEKTIELESTVLEKFLGKYKLDDRNITITIAKKDQVLVAQIPNRSEFMIFPVSETDFITKDGPIRISFNMDESGDVRGLVFNLSGKDSSAKKIE
jgi:D-alanyl-D-alanine-carboxypeptidase/D-alanyl-D-alanine-endopeptidase